MVILVRFPVKYGKINENSLCADNYFASFIYGRNDVCNDDVISNIEARRSKLVQKEWSYE